MTMEAALLTTLLQCVGVLIASAAVVITLFRSWG
jgi:hypothetical protein